MSTTPTNGVPTDHDELARLCAENAALRAELAQVRKERDGFERGVYDLLRVYMPPSEKDRQPPPTEGAVPLDELIEELERKLHE